MKEFKFDVDGIAIPIVNCETQIEFTKAVSSFRYSGGKLGVEAHEDEYVCNIYIIYKDGTCYYHNGVDKDEGKYKRTGIKSGIITDDNSAIVFGSFAINEYGNISIDESDIEEYGVYAGQYDVKEQDEQEVQETVEHTETETNEATVETVEKTERKINMKKSYNEMTIEELNKEHIRLIDWADEAETDRQAKSRLKKVSEFETYYKARFEELRATQATNETTVQETVEQAAEQETVEGISKTETATETDDSGFEYTTSQAQEIIMTGTSIAREKYREKHNIHSPMDLKKFSKKQLDDYLSKELDYINKFLNDTIPKEVFNAMKGEIMYA